MAGYYAHLHYDDDKIGYLEAGRSKGNGLCNSSRIGENKNEGLVSFHSFLAVAFTVIAAIAFILSLATISIVLVPC